MKTKHILTALALPALFAACTAEDIVNEGAVALQERPTVENLTVRVIEGAESRYAVNGTTSLKFNFENGDKFGAAIIDRYEPNKDPEEWEVISSLAGNTPFTYNANSGEWKAPEDLPMGLGHYLFVYPYNRADVNRAAVSYELPTVQKLYTEEDGEIDLNAAIEAGNKSFYSTVVTSPDVEDLEIPLENLYAYPKFVINFDNGEKVTTVSKVVLAKNDATESIYDGFQVKGGFNHPFVARLFANDENTSFYNTDDKATDWDLVQTADVLTSDGDYADIKYSDYLVAELPLNAEVEEVTNNKFIEVRFMIPGFLMNATSEANLAQYLSEYKMYVYTDNGAYSFTLDKAIEWKKTTKLAAKNRAFARGTANTINIDKDVVKKDKNAPFIVTSIADWNELVDIYGDEEKFGTEERINVKVVGGSLALDETAKMPEAAIFVVNSIAVAGDIELCNVDAGTVTVNKGATLTTCTSLVADRIINNGEVIVAAAYDKKGKAIACENVTEITNNSILTVEEDAIANFELYNAKKATFTNEGDVEIDGGYSYGDIENNGDLTFVGDFEIKEYEDEDDEPLAFVVNNGKILASADLTNDGVIINDGTITCRHNSGTIVNNGSIDSKKAAVTYITENYGDIKVYAIKLADYVTIEEDNEGKIWMEAEGEVDFKISTTVNSIVNEVVATGDLTIKNIGDVTTVTMTEEGELAVAGTLANLNVKANTTLASNVTVGNLNVTEGVVAHIPSAYTLFVVTDLLNKGTIDAFGVLNLEETGLKAWEDKVGDVEENGSVGEVKYYSDRKSNIQAAIKEYLTSGAEEYKADGYRIVLASFSAHLARIKQYGVEEEYPYGAICIDYTLTQKELDDAAASMYTAAELSNLVTTLKGWGFEKDATLYDYKTAVAKNKTTAYEVFKTRVKAHADATLEMSNAVYYAVTNLSEEQIDAILANKYVYIWEDCELDKLVEVWMSYSNFVTGGYDYTSDKANIESLIGWVKTILGTQTNQNPAIGQMQKAIADLGITAADYEYYEGYTTPQVMACCGVEAGSVVAAAAPLN